MFMPWDERVEIGDSDERHVLFNSRDMPCLIFLGAQHLVLVGWNSPLHRDRRTREPPAVPIYSIKFNCRVGYRTDEKLARANADRCEHLTCIPNPVPFESGAFALRDRRNSRVTVPIFVRFKALYLAACCGVCGINRACREEMYHVC